MIYSYLKRNVCGEVFFIKLMDAKTYKIKLTGFYLLIIFTVIHASAFCQDTIPSLKDTVYNPKRPYNITQFLYESHLLLKQPTTWKANNWLQFGAMVGLSAAASILDQPVRDATQPNQHFYNSPWIEGGRIYGEWYIIPGMTAVFGTYGAISGNDKSKKIAIELFQAGLFSEMMTYILKVSIGRARPFTDEGRYSFRPFAFKNEYYSFPSGHTTSAWALSAVISSTATKDWIKFAAYIPCGFTMFSRIYQDYHWISDSFGGAFVGYFVGNWVVDLHSERKHRINVTSMFPPTISISLDEDKKTAKRIFDN